MQDLFVDQVATNNGSFEERHGLVYRSCVLEEICWEFSKEFLKE